VNVAFQECLPKKLPKMKNRKKKEKEKEKEKREGGGEKKIQE